MFPPQNSREMSGLGKGCYNYFLQHFQVSLCLWASPACQDVLNKTQKNPQRTSLTGVWGTSNVRVKSLSSYYTQESVWSQWVFNGSTLLVLLWQQPLKPLQKQRNNPILQHSNSDAICGQPWSQTSDMQVMTQHSSNCCISRRSGEAFLKIYITNTSTSKRLHLKPPCRVNGSQTGSLSSCCN